MPNKPIRYLVNTHHHFDHAGGLRTFLSQGTTIVTHETNKQYYLDIMFYPAPRTLDPDRLRDLRADVRSAGGRRRLKPLAATRAARRRMSITDGVRMLEVFHVQDMAYELGDPSLRQGNHSQDMLMAYLPKEKILYNAGSLFTTGAGRGGSRRRPQPAGRCIRTS
mgnify:CR=1 FL=1